jgi:hypothetical protein
LNADDVSIISYDWVDSLNVYVGFDFLK